MGRSSAAKASSSLQRGTACLPCRKKKMKCDGARPSCGQCAKSVRSRGCEYEDTKKKSRTQALREKVAALEERLKELEPQGPARARAEEIPGPSQPFLTDPSMVASSSSLDPDGSAWAPQSFSALPSLDETCLSRDPPVSSAPTWLSPLRMDKAPDGMGGEAIPRETGYTLLDVFLSHHQQLGLHVNLARFKSSMVPGPEGTAHPALISAVYLWGCHFAQSPSLRDLKPLLLTRTLHFLETGLDSPEEMLCIIQASCLMSLYFYIHSQILDAYKHAAQAATLVVHLGVHLRGISRTTDPNQGIPGVTAGDIHLVECLAAFWQSFVLCYTLSALLGVPPLSMHAIEANEMEKPIVAALIPPIPDSRQGSHLTSPAADAWSIPSLNGLFLRAKVTALFHRSFLVASHTIASSPTLLYAMEQELDEALAYLPPTSHDTLPSMEVFAVLALANAIRINLYNNVPGQRYDQCLGAAFSMSSMVTLVAEDNYNQVDPTVSACLTIAARLLIDLLPENSPAPCGYGYREALNVLVIALRRLGVLFPVAGAGLC